MLIITIFNIILTISIYKLSLALAKKYPSPLTNPVFLSSVVIIFILSATKISYEKYTLAKDIMSYFLGPATVALAVPIYKNRTLIVKYFRASMLGLLSGSFITITSAILLAMFFHLPKDISLSLSVKSVTTPIAIEVGRMIGGNLPLIVGFVMITGMFGAMFGGKLLNLVMVDHPFARGLSIGTIAHGIGTAEAVREGEIQGAVAGASMGIAGVLTSCLIPYIIPFFL